MSHSKVKIVSVMCEKFARLRLNERGLAALEFAFIAPVFVMILLALISVQSKGIAHREVQQAAASVSDLASRYVYLDDARISALGAALDALLSGTPNVTNPRFALASFNNPDGTGGYTYTAVWSKTYSGAPAITNSEIQTTMEEFMTEGDHWLQNPNDTMLFLRVEADFETSYDMPGISSDHTIVRNAWVLPRYSRSTEFRVEDDT